MEHEIKAIIAGTADTAEFFAKMLSVMGETFSEGVRSVSVSTTRIAERWVEFDATQTTRIRPENLELDGNVIEILGVRLESDLPDRLVARGRIGIRVNNIELVPEDYQASGLFANVGQAPDERYKTLFGAINAGNREVEVVYEDKANANVAWSAYKVRVAFLVRLKD